MADTDRKITIKICGDIVTESQISIQLLADKLKALQQLFFNVGSALVGGGRRGTYKSEVIEACTLHFIESRPGSLEIDVGVPLSRHLTLPENEDLGLTALRQFNKTIQSIHSKDSRKLREYYPDYGRRNRILKAAMNLVPETESGYNIAIEFGSGTALLTSEARNFLANVSTEELDQYLSTDLQELTGRLYLIEVETGDRHIGLFVGKRQINCYYPAELEDTIREIIPGSVVELIGRATLDHDGNIKQIEEIIDIQPVQIKPLFWSRLTYENRQFLFTEPIQISVEFKDGVWIHEYEPLGILAYNVLRGESLNGFRMDFAASWDMIAQETCENLTEGAKKLKQRFRDIVRDVKEH